MALLKNKGNYTMFKKCKTNCQSDKYLWIRNNTFYFMFELPKQNNKRRYFCKSLHTKNYYEATERAKIMVKTFNSNNIEIKTYIYTAQVLLNKMVFDEYDEEIESNGQVLLQKKKRISPQTDPEVLNQFFTIIHKLKNIEFKNLSSEDLAQIQQLLQQEREITLGNVESLLKSFKLSMTKNIPNSDHTIEQIMESMFKTANNSKIVENKKRKLITNLITEVGLKITDKYSKFYTEKIIQQISENIKSKKVKNGVKRTYAREIKNLIMHAHNLNPDIYKTNLITTITDFKKTSKEDTNPHWPFTNDELKKIFDINNNYFKENHDVFWTTLIGMFVGARCNAAITLQYSDIVKIDNIDCIKFQDTHPIKQLKNEATKRTVPIPQQLLDLGFVEYINNQKLKLKAKDTDFIFPKCQTKNGQYNNKYTTRGFIKYITDIGITKNNPHKLDFHSLRKNANLQLESVGVQETFINDIIGWSGNNTRQKHYSNHELKQIKENSDKLRYDFLQTEFDYWKKVMLKK